MSPTEMISLLSSSSSSSSISSSKQLPLIGSFWLFLAIALLPCPGTAMNLYRYAPNGIGTLGRPAAAAMPKGASGFFGQPMPSTRNAFERRAVDAEFARFAANTIDPEASATDDALSDEAATASNSRIPRANNVKFARKNCFFSPLQCSFYYKPNSNFANVLMRGDEQ